MDVSKNIQHILHRTADAHKYDFGHVLIIGGSPGMIGAPLLAGEAAMRTGAGLVTIAAQQSMITALNEHVVEIMTLALPGNEERMLTMIVDFIARRKVTVVIIGPGLNIAAKTIKNILFRLRTPVIIDAGAFVICKEELLQDLAKQTPVILTPHLGEFARISPGIDTEVPITDQIQFIKEFAKKNNIILAVKGNPTIVSFADEVYRNHTNTPALATAGTGDVLTGVIAALISQGLSPFVATCTGVALHGVAGQIAALQTSEPSVIARDVIAALPSAMHQIAEE